MNFLYPIYTSQTECQDCYKCIRQCPLKAIRVEKGHAMVIPELCVMCGRCVTNCPAKAKHVRDDLAKTRQLFNLKKRVIVSLAPSFISEFPEYSPRRMIAALKQLGFWGVSETAIGADLVSAEVAKQLEESVNTNSKRKIFLSSACPVVVEYIKHELPDFEQYLTDIASPLLAHSRFLKKEYGDDIGIVFIGPCIAKKREADVWESIDSAITFIDLRRWFDSLSIKPENFPRLPNTEEDSFIPERAAKGSLYPIDGGMIASFKNYSNTVNYKSMALSGLDDIKNSLQGLENDRLTKPLFIELLSCIGGCINGPGSSRGNSTALKRVRLQDYSDGTNDTASKEILSTQIDINGILPVPKKETIQFNDEEIREALRSVGKYTETDELNCASCGYDTCRAFAAAMLDHRAEKTMCVSYMRKLAQKKANGLIQAIPSGVVIANKHLTIVECNLNFARLMGPDIVEMYQVKPGLEGADLTKITSASSLFANVLSINGPDVIEREMREGNKIFQISVFSIEKEEIAGGVIEDITAPRIQKRRIVSQAKKVIEKNLSVVQKVAFLLGENAADTESLLNSLIGFSENGDENNE